MPATKSTSLPQGLPPHLCVGNEGYQSPCMLLGIATTKAKQDVINVPAVRRFLAANRDTVPRHARTAERLRRSLLASFGDPADILALLVDREARAPTFADAFDKRLDLGDRYGPTPSAHACWPTTARSQTKAANAYTQPLSLAARVCSVNSTTSPSAWNTPMCLARRPSPTAQNWRPRSATQRRGSSRTTGF